MLLEQLDTLAKEKIYEKNFIQQEKIGQGGFASVYRVVHRIDDAEYAVKQIHLKIKDVKDDLQKHYEKLIREAKYLAQVNHPNVIRYYQSWLQVTEKKKHQKQAEQKRQAMELSSTSFSKKHPNPSKENSISSSSPNNPQTAQAGSTNQPATNVHNVNDASTKPQKQSNQLTLNNPSLKNNHNVQQNQLRNQSAVAATAIGTTGSSHGKSSQPQLVQASSNNKAEHREIEHRTLKQQQSTQSQKSQTLSDTQSSPPSQNQVVRHDKSNLSNHHIGQQQQQQESQKQHGGNAQANKNGNSADEVEEFDEKDIKSKKSKKDKSGHHRRAFIEEEENDNNDDSNTFYFDYDNDNEVVFVEDDDDEDEEEDEEDEEEEEEEEDEEDEAEEEEEESKDDNNQNNNNKLNNRNHNQSDEINKSTSKDKNKSSSSSASSSSSPSSKEKRKQEQQQQSPKQCGDNNKKEIEVNDTNIKITIPSNQLNETPITLKSSSSSESPLKRSNSSQIPKNQSEFQLVFESHEDQLIDELFPVHFERESSSNEDSSSSHNLPLPNVAVASGKNRNINRQRSNTNIPQESLRLATAASIPATAAVGNTGNTLQVPQRSGVNQLGVAADSKNNAGNQQQQQQVHSTKSYERRKNKSVDYLTVGQQQREIQLDSYDEIIFYLQTELCSTTLADYLTNRNKKIFSTLPQSTSNSVSQQAGGSTTSSNNINSAVSVHSQQLQSSVAGGINQQMPQSHQQRHMNMIAAPVPTYKQMTAAAVTGQLLKKNGLMGVVGGGLIANVARTVTPSPDVGDALSPEQKSEAIRILKEIIKGLWHIHHVCKMVHRDLKPHNIFLTEQLQVKIGDFGLVKKLSKLINPSAAVQYNDHQLAKKANPNGGVQKLIMSITNSLSVASTSPSESNSAVHDRLPFYLPKEEITSTCGTATYASPEQLSQKVEFFDHRADIYSLGIIILQLFHPMNTTMELVKTIKNCKAGELPKQFCIRYPQLAEIIKDSLENDPQKRPLLSTIESRLAEMEMLEGTLQSEDLGKLMLTFEDETIPLQRFGKIIRGSLYLYKTHTSGKAEYMYNLKECSLRLLPGGIAATSISSIGGGGGAPVLSTVSASLNSDLLIDSFILTHPIQQNIILKAATIEKTQSLFESLQKNVLL